MEGDAEVIICGFHHDNFNPRPPHGGRRGVLVGLVSSVAFQSTPSAWRATFESLRGVQVVEDFNPRPPHGGRRRCHRWRRRKTPISIHALRMEGDRGVLHPAAGRIISIHALRMEGDSGLLPS